MALQRIHDLLAELTQGAAHFPPTELYNEGWMLRLMLDWFANHTVSDHPLSFQANATWYSEALLPSAFLPRRHGDTLGESRTHADGVIGHFVIGQQGKADFDLLPGATQFLVLEAKMNSKLSSGTSNAPYFDQAVRNVACIAEVLLRANRPADQLTDLAFYVLAPQAAIDNGKFTNELHHDSIMKKVVRRVGDYQGEKDDWHANWFLPLLEHVTIETLSWESLLACIDKHDPNSAAEYRDFYANCLHFN